MICYQEAVWCFLKESQNTNENRYQLSFMKLKYLQANNNFKGLPTIDIPSKNYYSKLRNIFKGLGSWHPAVKSTGSSRGPRFNPQNQHRGSQLSNCSPRILLNEMTHRGLQTAWDSVDLFITSGKQSLQVQKAIARAAAGEGSVQPRELRLNTGGVCTLSAFACEVSLIHWHFLGT